jgi:hypothetical protein
MILGEIPDPDPTISFVSLRIWIHKTGKNNFGFCFIAKLGVFMVTDTNWPDTGIRPFSKSDTDSVRISVK